MNILCTPRVMYNTHVHAVSCTIGNLHSSFDTILLKGLSPLKEAKPLDQWYFLQCICW